MHYSTYLEARDAYAALPGTAILRRDSDGWLVMTVTEAVRGIVYDERARFERQFDGSYRRVR